jgi:vacuolar-type H+-ATPase subunit D/Vma8
MNRSQLLMLKNVELGTLDEGLQKTKQLQNAIDKKTICRLSKHMT